MRILLTGCNGLVGCRFAKKAEAGGAEVFGLSENGLTSPYILPSRYLRMDIRDGKTFAGLLAQIRPDVLVHTAALGKPDFCEQHPEISRAVNLEAPKILFREAERLGIYGVHLSTDFVFAGTLPEHTEETEDFPPVNVYGVHKRELELYLAGHHPQVASVRTALVYGYEPLLPRPNLLTWTVENLRVGRSIRVVDDQFRTPTFADDLAEGLWALCRLRLPGPFHLAGTDYLTVYELVRRMATVFSLDADLVLPVSTSALNEPARRPVSTRLLTDKAWTHLNYRPGDLDKNLAGLLAVYPH